MTQKNNKFLIPIGLVALLAAGCANSAANNPNNSTDSNNQSSDVSAGSQPPATASLKFSDQPYFQYAYLISGGTLSSDAQKAMTGFAETQKPLPDGTTQITLKALKKEYTDQQYSLQAGEQLYFIEKFLADDDTVANEDKMPGDDMAVVVDSQGNVVQQPAVFTSAASSTPAANPIPKKSSAPVPAPLSAPAPAPAPAPAYPGY